MTEGTATLEQTQTLRPLDTRIPVLATRAAVQLDNLILQKNKSVEAIRRLGASLRETAAATASAVSKKALIDPVAIRILRVVSEHALKTAPTTAADLVQQAKENGEKLLAAADGRVGADDLKLLRAYCLALSRAVASFHQLRQDSLKPLHRLRR
ncbi:MAG TPA: hypothetical protein VKT78_10345 [Fimbriimonadaceae bacterium]|nr:hypothetical protein [Fimbriimonadaceae bacterium]